MNIKLTNDSKYPTDELMPLLRLAWNTAAAEMPVKPTQTYPLRIGTTRTGTWHYRWTSTNFGGTSAVICVLKPGIKGRFPVWFNTIQLNDVNEVIVALAAWTFICLFRKARLAHTMARTAVEEYRKQNVAAKVEAVRQRKQKKADMAFGKMILDDMESQTLEFKLKKIERSRKTWERKLKLATTKLRTLRRREAALKAADARRQREPLVNLEQTA